MKGARWRVDGYVKCPHCDAENDGAELFGDFDGEEPFGLCDGLTSVEPCYRCGAHLRVGIVAVDASVRIGPAGTAS